MSVQHEVTQLLISLRQGDQAAMEALFPLVYRELHAMAHRQLARQRMDATLNTTALVHEAYLKLIGQTQIEWQDRSHFFAITARAMRHILVDYARMRRAQKRGGGAPHTLLDDANVPVAAQADTLLALDSALDQLAALDERLGRIVELRFFGGLSVEEAADVLAVSPRTVKRDWRKARAILYQMLQE